LVIVYRADDFYFFHFLMHREYQASIQFYGLCFSSEFYRIFNSIFLNFLCYKKLKQKLLILNIVKQTNMNQKQAFTILLFALLLAPCALGAANNDRVELKNVKALTLKKNAMTTGRRGAPVPQLQCSGHLCNYAPDTIQCVNVGSDGIDWR